MPYARPWEACMEWSKTYDSDIIHLNLAGTSVVVLSSLEATEMLLNKRSSIYSDRPSLPMVGDLMGWNFALVFMKYGEEWRTHRRLFNQEFNMGAVPKFHHAERVAAHALTSDSAMVGEVIVSVAYGIDVLPVNDPYVALAEEAAESAAGAAVPGRFFVDSIPVLKYVPEWFPGADFKRVAREGRLLSQAIKEIPFAETKRRMVTGDAKSCFTANALRELESGDKYYQESTVQNVAAMMYAAGADTTTAALSTFFLAMLTNPDAQKKAQQEIDSVVVRGHFSDFGDERQMPYVAALVKEVLRWRNATPLGAPHFLEVEDMYRGYRIPAKSIILANIWAISHDERMYPDHDDFKPERFLDGKLDDPSRNAQPAFGFGRRICPGRHMATSSIWITVVSILAMFDITKEIGEDGQPIEPSYEYGGGLIFPPTILLPSLVITPPRVAFGARLCDCEARRVLVDKSLNQSDPRHARPINGVNVVTFTHFINVGLFLGLLPYSKVLVIKPNAMPLPTKKVQ
ncbi:cytochrome P450 [Mycena metata]|uniref:Cytochrome P450 n=1 Tax=Mycena metata TaxID=1033252 RepID=A0AAD7H9A0_9AGAR|nr:cytochrome P450 [Mycena metata]